MEFYQVMSSLRKKMKVKQRPFTLEILFDTTLAHRTLSLLASPRRIDQGHWQAVTAGLSTMLVAGTALQASHSQKCRLSGRLVPQFIGVSVTRTFVLERWLHPKSGQYRRKTSGLSPPTLLLNVLGFCAAAPTVPPCLGRRTFRCIERRHLGAVRKSTVKATMWPLACTRRCSISYARSNCGCAAVFDPANRPKLIGSVIVGILVGGCIRLLW
jgi:hypothetical protein